MVSPMSPGSSRDRHRAVVVEHGLEIARHGIRVAPLDAVARHEVDQLAVLEEGDRRAARRDLRHVRPGAGRGFEVLAGEDGDDAVRSALVAESQADSGAGHAGGTAADGVDDQHRRAGLVRNEGVDVRGGPQFLDTGARELFAHRLDHQLAVWQITPPRLNRDIDPRPIVRQAPWDARLCLLRTRRTARAFPVIRTTGSWRARSPAAAGPGEPAGR